MFLIDIFKTVYTVQYSTKADKMVLFVIIEIGSVLRLPKMLLGSDTLHGSGEGISLVITVFYESSVC